MSSSPVTNSSRILRRYLGNASLLALTIGCTTLAGVALTTPASAANDFWTGTASPDWFAGANWSLGAPPAAGDNVYLDTTAPNGTLISGATASANSVNVGLNNIGMLTIANGGILNSGQGIIGRQAGSTGTASVSGVGSVWNAQGVAIGFNGAGTLSILNGGAVMSAAGYTVALGNSVGSSGVATVDGAGSTLSSAEIVVGEAGDGTLTVSNGGKVLTTQFSSIIGKSAASIGAATITGAGSSWVHTGTSGFWVGQSGTGTLTIANGGTVSVATDVVLGYQTGGVGTATVTGAGSIWSNAADMNVGRAGSGALTIADGGVVSVAGTMTVATMAGAAGALNIGAAAGAAAAAPGTLNAATIQFGAGNGTINFNHTGSNYSFAAAIGGLGTINQVAGTTILTADSSAFTGATSVTGGRLAVNGSLANSVVTISGGILGGTGTVGGIVAANGGTVGPGNSIGTLNVNGNVSFAAGSTYQVETNAAGQSDRIAATGSATLNGGTVFVSGVAPIGTKYTILSANGGIAGAFAGATGAIALPFLTYGLSYDATSVYLTQNRSAVTFASAGETRNQIATGGGADGLPLGGSLAGALVRLNLSQARGAFDQLSGEVHASAKGVMIEDSRFVREAAVDRLRAAFDGVGAGGAPVTTYVNGRPVLAAASTQGIAVWGRGFGSWGQWNGDGNAATLKRDIGGFVAGADAPFLDGWRLGAVGGYSRSNFRVTDRMSSGASDNYHLGLYGGTQWGDLAFRSGVAFTRHDISTGRSVAFPGFGGALAADYGAMTTQGFGELGYRIRAGQTPLGTLAFEPFANLAYVSLSSDGFTEKGGAAALTSSSSTAGVTFTTLGLRASNNLVLGNGVIATTRGMLGWRHGSGDTLPLATMAFAGGPAFDIAGVPIARDGAVADLGLEVNFTPNAALGLSYGGQFGTGVTDHTLRGNLAVRF